MKVFPYHRGVKRTNLKRLILRLTRLLSGRILICNLLYNLDTCVETALVPVFVGCLKFGTVPVCREM